jgi:hypothetical protein
MTEKNDTVGRDIESARRTAGVGRVPSIPSTTCAM